MQALASYILWITAAMAHARGEFTTIYDLPVELVHRFGNPFVVATCRQFANMDVRAAREFHVGPGQNMLRAIRASDFDVAWEILLDASKLRWWRCHRVWVFLEAADVGCEGIVRHLLDHPSIPVPADTMENGAVDVSLKKGHMAVARALLQHPSWLSGSRNVPVSALGVACSARRLDVIRARVGPGSRVLRPSPRRHPCRRRRPPARARRDSTNRRGPPESADR